MYRLIMALRAYPEVLDCYAFGEYVHASFKGVLEQKQLETYLQDAGLGDVEVKVTTPTIEDYFIKLLKR